MHVALFNVHVVVEGEPAMAVNGDHFAISDDRPKQGYPRPPNRSHVDPGGIVLTFNTPHVDGASTDRVSSIVGSNHTSRVVHENSEPFSNRTNGHSVTVDGFHPNVFDRCLSGPDVEPNRW